MSDVEEDDGVEESIDPEALAKGYLIDFISGKTVRGTPEEKDAVQPFAHRLVEDFGYPKKNIQTRPQFHVRRSPSDDKRSYPVDIAVFGSSKRNESDLELVVECKKPNRKDGRRWSRTVC